MLSIAIGYRSARRFDSILDLMSAELTAHCFDHANRPANGTASECNERDRSKPKRGNDRNAAGRATDKDCCRNGADANHPAQCMLDKRFAGKHLAVPIA
jgi:hypothetical protein